jgi:F-box protein 18 (helicase)
LPAPLAAARSHVARACVAAKVLLDEAQDCNPVSLQIVMLQQPHSAVIMVGDSHQAIYGFNKATDAMDHHHQSSLGFAAGQAAAAAATTLFLSQSFRFGPKLGGLASRLLGLKLESRRVLGVRAVDDEEICGRAFPGEKLAGFVRRVKDLAGPGATVLVASRTNAALLDALWDAAAGGLRLAVLDGIKARLESVQAHMETLAKARGESAPRAAAGQDSAAARLVQAWGGLEEARRRVEALTLRVVKTSDRPDVVFSTVHRAKGLEFEGVWLTDDFAICNSARSPLWRWLGVAVPARLGADEASDVREDSLDWGEEFNLLYVGVTRARRAVALCETLETAALPLLVPSKQSGAGLGQHVY